MRVRREFGWGVALMLALSVSGCTIRREHGTFAGPAAQTRSVVFDSAATSRFLWALSHCSELPIDSIGGTWTPSDNDIRLLEARLFVALRASLDRTSLRAQDYYFQYFGVLDQAKRIVLINGFHDAVRRAGLDDPEDWRQEPVVVCDAGMGEFQAAYDVESRQLRELHFFPRFNGPP